MILYRYILRNSAGPFLFSILVLTFIFLFNFLTKFADRLVGKGLGTWIITKLVMYNLAWMVVLVVPMAVLVATLMAFGNMSHNNEIAIMKASGVSVYRMLIAPFIMSIILCILLIQFNNHVHPDANHAARLLMQDISNKKPTLSLVPGLFSQDIPNYAILIRKIDEKNNVLYGVTIYDYSNPNQLNIVTAKRGKIYFSGNQKKLIMDLWDGGIHETNPDNKEIYRKLVFEKHRIYMSAEQFSFQQSTPGGMRGDRELSAADMRIIVDSLQQIRNTYISRFNNNVQQYIDLTVGNKKPVIPINSHALLQRVQERLNLAKNVVNSDVTNLRFSKDHINEYLVEIHKKYSIPFACIVFILIGAPLGIMTRKGGIGVAAGISVIFFLVYWAFLIGGEKLSDRGLLSPFWGMWSANFVLGFLGILLTVRAAKERVSISFSFLQKLIPTQWRIPTEQDEDN